MQFSQARFHEHIIITATLDLTLQFLDYDKLNDRRAHIRILLITVSTGKVGVCCKLRIVSLEEKPVVRASSPCRG